METISSASNPKIRFLTALQQKSSERRESGLFVVEGIREIEHCIEAEYVFDTVFVCPQIAVSVEPLLKRIRSVSPKLKIFNIDPAVYEKSAYRGSTEGIIAEVHSKEFRLEDLSLTEANPLVAVIEGVEKPGNVGAILRSCDACGVDALIICDPKCDLYNPNLIRSSIGAVFTVPCAVCSSQQAIDFLKARNFNILTAQLQDSSLYYDCDMTGSTAIVMGAEDTGLSDIWRDAASSHIRIPMLGKLDSLNVSVSAAILIYEALRQRKQN